MEFHHLPFFNRLQLNQLTASITTMRLTNMFLDYLSSKTLIFPEVGKPLSAWIIFFKTLLDIKRQTYIIRNQRRHEAGVKHIV